MKFNRLNSFQNNKEALAQYRAALAILYRLNIDMLLLELGAAQDVSATNPQILEVSALENQRAVGYKECLEDLFSLDTLTIPTIGTISPDYGAIDKMIADGTIKEEDIKSLMDGI